MTKLNRSLPIEIGELVMPFLEKEPDSRLSSARAALELLDRWCEATPYEIGQETDESATTLSGPVEAVPCRHPDGPASSPTMFPVGSRLFSFLMGLVMLAGLTGASALWSPGPGIHALPSSVPLPGIKLDGLVVQSGATRIRVEVSADREGPLVMVLWSAGREVDRQEIRIPGTGAVATIECRNLQPEATYEFVLQSPSGTIYHEQTVRTLRPEEGFRATLEMLKGIAPYPALDQLYRKLEGAAGSESGPANPGTRAQIRIRWTDRMYALYRRVRAQERTEDFAAMSERYTPMDPELRNAIFQHASELRELEAYMAIFGMASSPIASRLFLPDHRFLDRVPPPAESGILWVFLPEEPKQATESEISEQSFGKAWSVIDLTRASLFECGADPREEDQSLLADWGAARYDLPGPVHVPTGANMMSVELVASVHRLVEGCSFRILARSPGSDRSRGHLIAQLISHDPGQQVLAHRVDPRILPNPLYLSIEITLDRRWFQAGNRSRPEGGYLQALGMGFRTR